MSPKTLLNKGERSTQTSQSQSQIQKLVGGNDDDEEDEVVKEEEPVPKKVEEPVPKRCTVPPHAVLDRIRKHERSSPYI